MKQYCLKDIHWIYTNNGKFVTPFIFNHEKTKIRDLSGSDEVIELDISKSSPISAVSKYFSNILHTEDHLYTSQFSSFIINGFLQLKGVKNLKFANLKRDLLNNDFQRYETFIVNEEDIRNLTKELVQHLNPKTKLEKSVDDLHNLTSQF